LSPLHFYLGSSRGACLVGFLGFGRERERENTGEQTSSSPAFARPGEEEVAQCRSKRHRVVFHSFFFRLEKNESRNNPKMG